MADKLGYTLGGARVRVFGRYVGQTLDAELTKDVTKAEHTTNVGIEFVRDHVLSIMTAYGVSWTFQEIIPFNANLMINSPGFRAVPVDRKLSSPAIDPDIATGYGLIQVEYPTFGKKATGVGTPTWCPLLYPMHNRDLAAPDPAYSISAVNAATPGSVLSYVGYYVTLTDATGTVNEGGHESTISNVAIVPVYNAGAPGDTVNITVKWFDGTVPAVNAAVYRYVYTYNSTYDTYIGTFVAVAAHDFGAAVEHTSLAGKTATPDGGWTISIAVNTGSVLVGAKPPLPVEEVVHPVTGTSADWLTDYEINANFRGGSAIKRTATSSTIGEFETWQVSYVYNAGAIAEAPLGTTEGENTVLPVTLEIPFTDNLSKMVIHLWEVQTNANFRLATNERDWMGIPFVGEALDASDEYPDYPYGYVQVMGPLASRIVQGGNVPFGMDSGLTGARALRSEQQTSWA